MSDAFFSKYRSFLKASEDHARNQEVAIVLRDLIAELGENDDVGEVIQALEAAERKHRTKADALMPIFMREMKAIDQPA